MNQIKRFSGFNEFYYSGTKRLRSLFNEEYTCIEQLSNELFYEIFDYLDGCSIYEAFVNLNSRFQYFITHSSSPLNIDLRSPLKSVTTHNENVIVPNKHRIISLHIRNQLFINPFLGNCTIDSLFIRLESIVLTNIRPDKFVLLLVQFKSLPRLFSLTVDLDSELTPHLNNIYQIILSLPSLKYNKLSLITSLRHRSTNISISLVTTEQFSTIEYLVINHNCTVNNLISILCYTPRLHHLVCGHLVKSNEYMKIEKLITLSNLTYISIGDLQIGFVEFEMFMRKLSTHIQVLRIRKSYEETYLDADRWKKLIVKYMPDLRIFNFEYHKSFQYVSFDTLIYWCTSPFWSQRRWYVELKIDKGTIVHSIHPYRKTWLDIHEHAETVTYFDRNINDNSTQQVIIPNQQKMDRSSAKIQLSISNCSFNAQDQLFIDDLKPVFDVVQFTCLNINCKEIPIMMLVRILQLLPNLDSLKVLSLPPIPSDWLLGIVFPMSINNKITKINLERMTKIEQTHFLLHLCFFVQYLQVSCDKDTNLEILVRSVLMTAKTYTPHFNCLCLEISNATQRIVCKLQKMIDAGTLLANYTIKRIGNTILLKWK